MDIITQSMFWMLSIISCMTSWHNKKFSLGFLSDIDEWDHLCKNVSWAEIQSGGRISETGVGSFPIQVVWSAWRHGSQEEYKRFRKSLRLARVAILKLTAHDSHLRSFEKLAIPGRRRPVHLIQLLHGAWASVFFQSFSHKSVSHAELRNTELEHKGNERVWWEISLEG